MGTNYYLHKKPACAECGHEPEPLHIGKSYAGWCFSMHVMPEKGINTIDDWRALWKQPGARIRNEYDDWVTAEEMEKVICERSGCTDWNTPWWASGRYANEADFHANNESERGPNGLLRHRIGWFCVGHGNGTYDYITGDFS